MYSSRWVLASTEAAAMSAKRPSPLTKQRHGISSVVRNRLPSIASSCGAGARRPAASDIASNEALRMLISSIRAGGTASTAQGDCFAFDHGAQPVAIALAHLLRVVEQRIVEIGRQDHRRGEDGAGQAAAPRLVASRF